MPPTVYTIGHSTHPKEDFVTLLSGHGITAVCDVRSQPYSRFNPQFRRDELEQWLPAQGIRYLFLGRELGARSSDPACYEHGRVKYDRIAQTGLFQRGLVRIQDGLAKGFRIALMCAEREPLACHRTILVARHLTAIGIGVRHILADGSLESHAAVLNRLVRVLKLPETDLFRSREELLADAYRRQEDKMAARRSIAG
jgi:uncharacterized protein (DUF488 family)